MDRKVKPPSNLPNIVQTDSARPTLSETKASPTTPSLETDSARLHDEDLETDYPLFPEYDTVTETTRDHPPLIARGENPSFPYTPKMYSKEEYDDLEEDCCVSIERMSISGESMTAERRVKELGHSYSTDDNVEVKTEVEIRDVTDAKPVRTTRVTVAPDVISAIFRQDEDGDTQLHIALVHRIVNVVIQILSLCIPGPYFNIQNNLRQTVLHLAVLIREPTIVRKLLCVGAHPEARDRKGNTPLHLACRDGSMDCVRELTKPISMFEVDDSATLQQLPQNMDIRNYDGDTCLHLAAANNHPSIVEYLIGSHVGADVNARDGKSGRTILHHAVEARNDVLVKLLLRCEKIVPDAKTFDGNSACALAYGRGYYDIFNTLVKYGAHLDNTVDEDMDF